MAGAGAGEGQANGSAFRGESVGATKMAAGNGEVDWDSLLKQQVVSPV